MEKEIINIKGTRNGLVILVESDKDFNELKTKLKEKIVSSKGFFKGAKFSFNLDKSILSVDKEKELEAICREHGLIPSEKEIGLIRTAETEAKKEVKKDVLGTNENPTQAKVIPISNTRDDQTLLLTTSLRSGQKVNYEGNVTILGDVNPGSEIVATGDIVVMGTLRGIAHAGATGNLGAIIVAYRLKATQIRIADKIGRSPDNEAQQTCEPEIAFIQNNQIEIQTYIPNKLKLG